MAERVIVVTMMTLAAVGLLILAGIAVAVGRLVAADERPTTSHRGDRQTP